MRPPEPIPPDQITARELMPWHVVTVECGNCPNGRVIDPRWLKRAHRADKLLSQVNWRCERCGMTSAEVRHVIRIVPLPRNY